MNKCERCNEYKWVQCKCVLVKYFLMPAHEWDDGGCDDLVDDDGSITANERFFTIHTTYLKTENMKRAAEKIAHDDFWHDPENDYEVVIIMAEESNTTTKNNNEIWTSCQLFKVEMEPIPHFNAESIMIGKKANLQPTK